MLLTMFCVFAASSGKSAYPNLVLGLTQQDCFATMRVGADNTTIGGQTAPLARLFHALKVSMGWMSQTVRLAACPIACYQHPSHPMPLIRQMVDVQNSIGSMKMSTSISSVAFNGTTLTLASINNKPYVAIKPICDAMGIDWNAQFQKIKRDLVLNSTMCITHMVAEDGKQREMVCLPLEYLNGWLFKIDARRVRNPQAQVAVVQYQRECYSALNNYWNGKVVAKQKPPKPKNMLRGKVHKLQHACEFICGSLEMRVRIPDTLWQNHPLREGDQIYFEYPHDANPMIATPIAIHTNKEEACTSQSK